MTEFETGPNLLVKSFAQQAGTTMVEEEGWISYKQRQKEKRPAWSYVIEKTAALPRVSFVTILAPFEGASAPEVEAQIVPHGQRAECRMTIGRTVHRIEVNWEGGTAVILD